MRLIGMLDSPFVRRVAISLDALGVAFEHESVSVFSTFEKFRGINPVVKAPTLVCDDGGVLMDSALILQYVESTRAAPSPLWSADARLRLLQFRAVSYASAAAEKSVQLVYEMQLRPPSAQHEPWKTRVRSQFTAAYAALESMLGTEASLAQPGANHAAIWLAVVWQFAQSMIADELPASRYPRLVALSAQSEALPVFLRWPPDGPGVPAGSA
jgi:glutathione S-transferase